MRALFFSLVLLLAATAHAFIFFPADWSAVESAAYHADNIDNGAGTNVVLSGAFSGSLDARTLNFRDNVDTGTGLYFYPTNALLGVSWFGLSDANNGDLELSTAQSDSVLNIYSIVDFKGYQVRNGVFSGDGSGLSNVVPLIAAQTVDTTDTSFVGGFRTYGVDQFICQDDNQTGLVLTSLTNSGDGAVWFCGSVGAETMWFAAGSPMVVDGGIYDGIGTHFDPGNLAIMPKVRKLFGTNGTDVVLDWSKGTNAGKFSGSFSGSFSGKGFVAQTNSFSLSSFTNGWMPGTVGSTTSNGWPFKAWITPAGALVTSTNL